jgi:type IX secretion system PorP/SprF family membrane protein
VRRINIHIFVLVLTLKLSYCSKVVSQQLPLYSQYMFNLQNANVAYTGAKNYLSTSLIYRTQWVGFTGAPKYQHFTIQSPIQKENAGIGLQFINDNIGQHGTTGGSLSYAYKLKLLNGNLAFGLRAGIFNYKYNWSQITYKDNNDVSTINSKESKMIPSFDCATIFYNQSFFVGLEVAQLAKGKFINNEVSTAEQSMHFNAIIGKAFSISENLVLKPSMIFRFLPTGQSQADFNTSLLLKKIIWLGIGYRTKYGAQFLTEIYATSQLRIGYSYDYGLNGFKSNQTGSHEIFIGYDFNIFKTSAASPRYF